MGGDQSRPVLVVTPGFGWYHQELTYGAAHRLASCGPTLVVVCRRYSQSGMPASVVQLLRAVMPYGVLATPMISTEEEMDLVGLLNELEIPTVRIAARSSGMTCVRGDDLAGMRAVMSHLLDERGIRRPALARGIPHQPDAIRREQVFREELAVRGIPVDEDLIFEGGFWHEISYRELRVLLSRRRDMDAVVAANDTSALGAVKALADEGLRVPEDVLVTGFDNAPSALCWPALTTVDQDFRAQGAAAATRLLAEIDGAAPGAEVPVPSRLVIRGSTRASTVGDSDHLATAVDLARMAQEELTVRDALWALSFAMSHCTSRSDVAETLAKGHLLRLGIDRCFLGIYTDEPLTHHVQAGDPGADPRSAPDFGLRVRLILNYCHGNQGPVPSEIFPVGQLLPTALRHELESGLLVFQPLVSTDRELGYVLFEQRPGPGLVCDWLRMEMSRTLEALLSTQELKDHAANLEHMVVRRTTELASRSEQLEAEVKVRRDAEQRLQEAVSDLHRIAMSDGLTQLANRVHLRDHLDTSWKNLARHGGELALLMIDVDLFKAYNDFYGHLRGDEALRIVARHLSEAARYPQDLACRYGGEEFVLLLPGTGLEAARLVAERFQESLVRAAIPHARSTVVPVVTVSIGIAAATAENGVDPWTLLEYADRALYHAKIRGRNQICSTRLGPGPGDEVDLLPLAKPNQF